MFFMHIYTVYESIHIQIYFDIDIDIRVYVACIYENMYMCIYIQFYAHLTFRVYFVWKQCACCEFAYLFWTMLFEMAGKYHVFLCPNFNVYPWMFFEIMQVLHAFSQSLFQVSSVWVSKGLSRFLEVTKDRKSTPRETARGAGAGVSAPFETFLFL